MSRKIHNSSDNLSWPLIACQPRSCSTRRAYLIEPTRERV
ncbi:unnamed protein product [Tenebrio molitor]|nr:unnamed protein product [Tenebrio molitor]